MKRWTNAKITQNNFSNLISNAALIIGFILLFGVAGGMDYNAATGASDGVSQVVLLVVGMACLLGGMYGKRKDF